MLQMLTFRRLFHQFRPNLSHENPLGLPKIPRRSAGLPVKQNIPGISKIILVSSAKGGVGKSTVTANIALSLQKKGLRVGILDADIFGPSIPKLFNISGEPRINENGKLLPKTNYGLQTMSMGYLIPNEESAVTWRGLMVIKALQQLLFEVAWKNLDFLVIDMPPGTGDVQLTVSQQLKVSGAVIVSTPQDLALIDVKKGITMFEKTQIPILGLVQNMSYYHCPNCGHDDHLFGQDLGIKKEVERSKIDLLGEIPLNGIVAKQSDLGKPIAISDPDSKISNAFSEIADKLVNKLRI